MNVMMLVHYYPWIALTLGALVISLCVPVLRAPWEPKVRKHALSVVLLLAFAFIAFAAYEWQLAEWKQKIEGAPIRVDMFVLGLLIYFAVGKIHTLIELMGGSGKGGGA